MSHKVYGLYCCGSASNVGEQQQSHTCTAKWPNGVDLSERAYSSSLTFTHRPVCATNIATSARDCLHVSKAVVGILLHVSCVTLVSDVFRHVDFGESLLSFSVAERIIGISNLEAVLSK